jgi:hypothetical protein
MREKEPRGEFYSHLDVTDQIEANSDQMGCCHPERSEGSLAIFLSNKLESEDDPSLRSG